MKYNKVDNSVGSVLIELLKEFNHDYDKITDIYHYGKSEILNGNIDSFLDYFIRKLIDLQSNLFKPLYLCQFYYYTGNPQFAKRELKEFEENINSKPNRFKYTPVVEQLRILINSTLHNENLDSVTIVITNISEEKSDKNYWKIIKLIAQAIRKVTGVEVRCLIGNKELIIPYLNINKPEYLVLVGHSDYDIGHRLFERVNISEYFTPLDLDLMLQQYNSQIILKLLDMACSDGIYGNQLYPINVEYGSNAKHTIGTFNESFALLYSIGWFKGITLGYPISNSHLFGILFMSVIGTDYIETFDWKKINHE